MRKILPPFGSNLGILLSSALILFVMVGLAFLLQILSRTAMERELRLTLESTASIGATLFTGEQLDAIRGPEDVSSPWFRSMVDRLNSVKDANRNIAFAYIMRRTNSPMTLEFVADADALDTFAMKDENSNGIIEEDEESSLPGDTYDISEVPAMQHDAFLGPTSDDEFTTDQWGSLISGYAPIYRTDGSVAGILGIDMRADDFIEQTKSSFSPRIFLLIIAIGLLCSIYLYVFIVRKKMTYLHKLNRERSGVLQLAMHQIGTPLTVFKWSLEHIEEVAAGKTVNNDDLKEHIGQMKDGIEALQGVFQALVETSKVSEGNVDQHKERVEICSLIDVVKESLQFQLEKKQQTLSINCSKDKFVMIDPKLLQGVIEELLKNASYYSDKGTQISIDVVRTGTWIKMIVQDEGCGISPTDQKRVFERFTRGDNAYKMRSSGNGLGLYVVRSIIERSGGSIELESEEGKGTTITVKLREA